MTAVERPNHDSGRTADRRNLAGGRRRRLAVARFWHEGNAFAPIAADMAAFERCEWSIGDAALEAARGTATELGAVAAFVDAHPEWDVVLLRCASALPSGPIDDTVFDCFSADLQAGIDAGLRAGGWDAVYLSLHGAAITTTRQTPDLDLVRLVRRRIGAVPLGASFDLHANMAPELAPLLDVASAYRTHPHVDMVGTAGRVLEGLVRCADGSLSTHRVLRNDRVLLPSFNMRTREGPMRELEEAARALTTGPIVEVALFGGFPYADTIHAGASVLAISDRRGDPGGSAATHAANVMSEHVERLAPSFAVRLPRPDEAIEMALASTATGAIAVTDPADNPLSGGGCDTPALLSALLAAHVEVPTVFASFADPGAVAAAAQAGVGATIDVTLGARFGPQFGNAVRLIAIVERITDGVFRNVGPMETGIERRCGKSAVLVVADQPCIRIIVTSAVVPADDPAFYALHGVETDRLRLLCVKAKNHFRAGMGAKVGEIIACDAPGPACLDLSRLPFRNRVRHTARI